METPSVGSPGEVVQLPREFSTPSEERFIVERYKALRLRCLQQEPEAFSSTYEDESQFPDETWVQRVKNPFAKTFVAVRNTAEDKDIFDDGSNLSKLSREWVGLCVLIGPKPLTPERSDPIDALWAFMQTTANTNTEPEPKDHSNQPLSYCTVSMFVSPDQRGCGFGRKLIDAVIEGGRKDAKELMAPKAYLTIFFEVDNRLARRLYGKWGFTIEDDINEYPDKNGENRPIGWGWALL
ncbi:hypothetical protein FQN54_002011 [Arachnomyces sp. PD_36]|nr:hypothetical protein FQN54_002011 [Arachnomyces sp. PD_36]